MRYVHLAGKQRIKISLQKVVQTIEKKKKKEKRNQAARSKTERPRVYREFTRAKLRSKNGLSCVICKSIEREREIEIVECKLKKFFMGLQQ